VSLSAASAGTVGIYEFAANPCFTTTRYVWVLGFEAVFPAANVTQDAMLVFTAFVTKDTREAHDSVTARVWSMDLDNSLTLLFFFFVLGLLTSLCWFIAPSSNGSRSHASGLGPA